MSIFAIVSIVARLTKTKADDEIVSSIGKFLNIVFSKTNTKGSFEKKLSGIVLEKALEEITDKDRGLASRIEKKCEEISGEIENKIGSRGKRVLSEVIKSAPKSAIANRIKNRIQERIRSRIRNKTPKTGLGKVMKGMFGGD